MTDKTARVFVQTAKADLPNLDRWVQIGEEEARLAYDMVLRNEAVHLWGNVCDMDALTAISRETGIPVIKDCAHAHGAKYKGKMTGGIGAAGAWSMQGSKAVSGGEAGVIATNDSEVFDRACLLGQVNRLVGTDLATDRYERYQPLRTVN